MVLIGGTVGFMVGLIVGIIFMEILLWFRNREACIITLLKKRG